VDVVVTTRTSNKTGRNRHRPRFFLADVRREGTLRAGLPELALKVEMGWPPNRIAHHAANSLLLAHDRKHLTRGGAYARLGRLPVASGAGGRAPATAYGSERGPVTNANHSSSSRPAA